MIKAMSKVFAVVVVVLAILLLLCGGLVGYFAGSYYGAIGSIPDFETLCSSLNYQFSMYSVFGAIIGLVIFFIIDSLTFGYVALMIQISRNLNKINNKLK